MPESKRVVGGYFELQFPSQDENGCPGGLKFNSARSAFNSLVSNLGTREIWLPSYLCDSIATNSALKKLNVNFYRLADDFSIRDSLKLGSDSLLLYVNYFGVCAKQARETILSYGRDKVVIDNSQAMHSEHFSTLATLYSPRKFFGLPDGGILYTNDRRVKQPETRDTSSITRMSHLLKRLAGSPESGYQDFLKAEQEIGELPVLGMSNLTEHLLRSVDFEDAKKQRIQNALFLHNHLGRYNKLSLDFTTPTAPLCYPLLPNVKFPTRDGLSKEGVFIPSYWSEVLSRVKEGSFEWNLATNALFLPCDQRYSLSDMQRVVSLLESGEGPS